MTNNQRAMAAAGGGQGMRNGGQANGFG